MSTVQASLVNKIAEVGGEKLMKLNFVAKRLATWGTMVWMIVSLLWFAFAVVSQIDGVDLYFFVCHGRDFASGYQPSQTSSYIYFPGVYRVWAAVFTFFSASFFVVQCTVMSSLLLNAVLVGALVYRLSGTLWFGCLGGTLYVALATRFEGLLGTGEPLATIPFLFGLLCWLSLKSSVLRTVSLGIAIAITVFMKQQAGLLSVGVAAMFFLPATRTSVSYRCEGRFKSPVSLAGIAIVVFAALILFEGRGFFPVETGLQMVHEYEQQSSFWRNLYDLIRNDEAVVLFAVVSACGMVMAVFNKVGFKDRHAHAFALLCLSSMSTLLQFRLRGYYHYFLLALPGLVIVSTAATAVVVQHMYENSRDRNVFQRNALLLILASPFLIGFLRVGERDLAFDLLNPFDFSSSVEPVIPWHHQPEVADGIQALEAILEPGDELVVLPPIRSAINFATGTVNPTGYAFGEFTDVSRHELSRLRNVAFLIDPRSERDEKDWRDSKSSRLLEQLSDDPNFERTKLSSQLQLFYRRR